MIVPPSAPLGIQLSARGAVPFDSCPIPLSRSEGQRSRTRGDGSFPFPVLRGGENMDFCTDRLVFIKTAALAGTGNSLRVINGEKGVGNKLVLSHEVR